MGAAGHYCTARRRSERTRFDPTLLHKMSTSTVSASQHFLFDPSIAVRSWHRFGRFHIWSNQRIIQSSGPSPHLVHVLESFACSSHLCTASLDSNRASLWASVAVSSVKEVPPCTCQRLNSKTPGLGGSSVLATQTSALYHGLNSFSNPTQMHGDDRSTTTSTSTTSKCLGWRLPRISWLSMPTYVPSAAVGSLRCRSRLVRIAAAFTAIT
jgi:hypothetical protein